MALIVVHMWGNVLNLNRVKKICKSFNIKLIEDAAEALGSYLKIKIKKFMLVLLVILVVYLLMGTKL